MLRVRIVTAVAAAALLLLVLFVLPETAARAVIAAVILVAAWEWSGFLHMPGVAGRIAYVAMIAAFLGAVTWALPSPEWTGLILKAALVWWFAALIWSFFYPTPIARPLGWFCGALVMVPAYIAFTYLYTVDPALLLFVLVVVWAADVGAYFTGRRYGRVPLAPAISPGKTWEGVIGGLAAVVVVLVAARLYWLEIEFAVILPFCLAVAAMSVVGDLTVSMFKRNAGVKDSGRLFPGHGGLLDRIDSVAAATPLFALGVGWTGIA